MADQTDHDFMQRAIALAGEGGGPIGCVITRDGRIIGEGHNEVALRCDATAHAEMVAMRRAGEHLRAPQLRGATLYATLQPCGMCTMACIWNGITRIVYGAERYQVHKMYFEDRHLDTMDFIRDAFRDDISIEGGVRAQECAGLYYGPEDTPPRDQQTNL